MPITLDQAELFFRWCSVINMSLLFFAFLALLLLRDKAVRLHSRLFKIPEESVALAFYSFLGLWKLLTFLFFIIPWVSILLIQ